MEASGQTLAAMITLGKQMYYGAGTNGDAAGHPGLLQGYDAANMTVDATGTTDSTCSSVWAVKFGPQYCGFCIGGNGEFKVEDVQTVRLLDAQNKPFTGYMSEMLAHSCMIGLDVRMKKFFFDTVEVERRISKKKIDTLRNMAAYATKTAQRSMRRVGKKGKPSKAPNPPKHHGADPSLRTIWYALDPVTERSIAGPIKFNQKFYYGTELRSGTVPQLHEEGGVLGIREKRVGKKWVPIGRRKPRPGQPTRRRNAKYPARPYMGPAQEKTVKRFYDVYYGTSAAA